MRACNAINAVSDYAAASAAPYAAALPRRGCWGFIALAAISALAAGCGKSRQIRDPEYAQVARAIEYSPRNAAVAALPPVVTELAGPHDVRDYIQYALMQQPEIQAARKLVEAKANRVPQAASLQDPMLGTIYYPEPVQTAAGPQQFGLNANQQLPWFGKLNRRASAAEAETDMARAELAAVELEVIEQVKRAYYELYYLQKAIAISEQDRVLLVDFVRIADTKYRTGQASQQDVLRAEVEVASLDAELIELREQKDVAQARLARLLHISPDTRVAALPAIPADQIPTELNALYEIAVARRPELHAQLAAVTRDRERLDLARLNYFPDATLGTSWISTGSSGLSPVANGRDAVLVNLNVNVPIYRKRLDAGVREAEAQVVASARNYDSLRDRTVEQVKDLFVEAQSQRDLLQLFATEILPRAEQTLNVSVRAYEVGSIDFLTLDDNWQQLLRFQITYYRLEAQLQQTLASLERLLGGPLPPSPPAEAVALPAGDVMPRPMPDPAAT